MTQGGKILVVDEFSFGTSLCELLTARDYAVLYASTLHDGEYAWKEDQNIALLVVNGTTGCELYQSLAREGYHGAVLARSESNNLGLWIKCTERGRKVQLVSVRSTAEELVQIIGRMIKS